MPIKLMYYTFLSCTIWSLSYDIISSYFFNFHDVFYLELVISDASQVDSDKADTMPIIMISSTVLTSI